MPFNQAHDVTHIVTFQKALSMHERFLRELSNPQDGAGMLHLRELRVLRCVACLERQRGCGKIGLLLRPLFPPLDATCPARAW